MADSTKLTNALAEAVARLAAASARDPAEPAAERARAPAVGDVYAWPPPNELALSWAVVSDHPTDAALVYVVPVDGSPLAGLADVVVRDAGRERLSLRCGRGQWVRRADLRPERRFRALSEHHVRRAQHKLREIVNGPLDGSTAAWEDEADPDYHAWIAELTEAVLGAARGRQPLLLSEPSFTARLLNHGAAAERALAAAGTDSFDELLAPLAPVEVLASPIPFDGPGALLAVRGPDGAALVFESASPADPPAVAALDPSGEWRELAWAFTPDRTAARAVAPWVEGAARIRVGSGDDAREVIVSQS